MAKLALGFHVACGLVTLGALVVVWQIGRKLGTIDRAATFLEDVGFAKDFQIKGPVLFRGAAVVTAALVVLNTVGTLVLAFLYNSLSGVLGGLIFSVLEEQPRPRGDARGRRGDRDTGRGRGRDRRQDRGRDADRERGRSSGRASTAAPDRVPAPVAARAAVVPPAAPSSADVGSRSGGADDWLAAAREGG